MKRYFNFRFLTLLILCIFVSSIKAYDGEDFTVDGINYTVISETEKTCRTKSGNSANPGNSNLTGTLNLTSQVIKDGDNYTLTSIGNYSFYACRGLTGDLVIPESVTSIGRYAFTSCSGFNGILKLPDNLTSIGDDAFQYCSGFTGDLVIPESVTSIGLGAFSTCSGFIGKLEIKGNLKTIPHSAFYRCSGFTGELKIPYGVTSIGGSAFIDCSGFTGNLVIPESVTSIDDQAFALCSGLTGSLIISESVTSIGVNPFFNCSGLEHISVEKGNTKYLSEDDIIYNYDKSKLVLCLTSKQGELNIDNNTGEISDYAFFGCSGLTGQLIIPKSVTKIGDVAFRNCSGFTGDLVIPESVTSIGMYAFYGCSGFNGNLVIPESVTEIRDCAFRECSGFTGNLVIPKSVTKIGFMAFIYCSGFNGNLVIPESVTEIGSGAFRGCSGLTGNLVIPETVTSIRMNAFNSCKGFTGDLVIPESVTSIESSAFEGCSGFNGKLEIKGKLKTIQSYAFYGCSGFTGDLVIPESVTSIGAYAFSGCSGLDLIISLIKEKIPSQQSSMFPSDFAKGRIKYIYVSDDCYDDYVSTWSSWNIAKISDLFSVNLDDESIVMKEGEALTLMANIKEAPGVDFSRFNLAWSSENQLLTVEGSDRSALVKSDYLQNNTSIESAVTVFFEDFPEVNATASVTVIPRIPGDANDNGDVTVADVVTIANHIAEKKNDNFCFVNANVIEETDHEGWEAKRENIKVNDLTETVNIILGKSSLNKVNRLARNSQETEDGLSAVKYASDNGTLIEIDLDNSRDYVSLQADILIPEGMKVKDISKGSRSEGHNLVSNINETGILKVVLYNLTNTPFTDEAGPILTIYLEGSENELSEMYIENIFASDAESNNHELIFLGVTDGEHASVEINTADIMKLISGKDSVTFVGAQGETAIIYSLSGNIVKELALGSDFETISLDKGVYIVRCGKLSEKVIIK